MSLVAVANVFGFFGAFLLIVRLLPLIREQLQEPKKIDLSFLVIELLACFCLGTTAVLIRSHVFIAANCVCFVNLTFLISIQIKLRWCNHTFEVDPDEINIEPHPGRGRGGGEGGCRLNPSTNRSFTYGDRGGRAAR